jgi:hypothetical protein
VVSMCLAMLFFCHSLAAKVHALLRESTGSTEARDDPRLHPVPVVEAATGT